VAGVVSLAPVDGLGNGGCSCDVASFGDGVAVVVVAAAAAGRAAATSPSCDAEAATPAGLSASECEAFGDFAAVGQVSLDCESGLPVSAASSATSACSLGLMVIEDLVPEWCSIKTLYFIINI
jgi:hypothetical protein